MKLNKFARMLYSKPLGKRILSKIFFMNKKYLEIPLKGIPGKIMEISWNFAGNHKKWEPWYQWRGGVDPQVNKFEQASNDDHQLSVVGVGWGRSPGLMSREGGGSE